MDALEPLYLDHAATSPPLPEALAAGHAAAAKLWANPASLHAAGAAAAQALERARREILAAWGAEGARLVFTATGTESNHLGVLGLARAARRRAGRAGGRARVLVGAAEHACVRAAAEALAREGFQVETVPVDGAGIVRAPALASMLGPDVALVAVQAANNELGGLNPVAALAALTRQAAPHAAFHCDAVQWAGKRPEAILSLGADAIAVAAHKLGGLHGCAALLLREGARLPQPIFGGAQESGLRGGTEDVPGAVAFAAAATARTAALRLAPRRLLDLRRELLQHLRRAAPDLLLLGPEREEECLGAIVAVALPGARARTLLSALDARGVQVGSGSACHGGGVAVSLALEAIGLAPALRGSVLRFSLGGAESPAQLARAADALAAARAALAASPASRVS